MTRDELTKEAQRLSALYHDAFLVDLFGVEGAGLNEARLVELNDAGLISLGDEGLEVGGLTPFEYLLGMGHVFGDNPEDHAELREYDVNTFTPRVVAKVDDLRSRPRDAFAPPVPIDSPEVAQSDLGPPPPPEWMSPAEVGAYQRATMRAGEYARGLGNMLSEELADVVAETWIGEEIVEEVLPEQRAEMLEIIREETGRELATSRDARRLAGTLADRSKYYAHNWQRIANTELQGAHNEGRVIASVQAHGEGAQVARVPNTGACDDCLRLVTEEGRPRVFSVAELQQNGVNVGRSRDEWLATIFPIHPNCRCDLISVPPDFEVLEDGRLHRRSTVL